MSGKGFEDLHVYRRAEELADLVWTLVRNWGRLDQDTVGKQLIRAADSIGANIAEGFGRGSYQDNRRFIRIARGSLYESRPWLRRAFRRSLLTSENVCAMKAILDKLGPRLNAYLSSIGHTKKTQIVSTNAPPITNNQGLVINDKGVTTNDK